MPVEPMTLFKPAADELTLGTTAVGVAPEDDE